MVRKVFIALVSGLVMSVLVLSGANAATTNPTGVISCTVTGGTISISPGLTNTPSIATVSLAISGAGTSCDNSGVTGGKAPITDFSFAYSSTLDSATCSDAIQSTTASTVQITWQNRKSNGKLKTVAVTTGQVGALFNANLGTWAVLVVPDATGAFADMGIRLDVLFDAIPASNACATVNGWTSSTLSGGAVETF
jgi:hypothetical protein